MKITAKISLTIKIYNTLSECEREGYISPGIEMVEKNVFKASVNEAILVRCF